MSALDAKLDESRRRAVEQALESICASDEFGRSERLTRFLKYIVRESLDGEVARLKAYSIALSVFDRPESFDPQLDPVVRIEAGRLRRALERYYAGPGADDVIIIGVPKGAYVPSFSARERPSPNCSPAAGAGEPPVIPQTLNPASRAGASPSRVSWRSKAVAGIAVIMALMIGSAIMVAQHKGDAAEQDAPVLAIVPILPAGGDERANQLARGISEELIDRLASYSELRILGRETVRTLAASKGPEFWKQYHVRYVIEGSVLTSPGGGSLAARLTDARSGQVLWSERYSIASTDDIVGLQSDLGRKLADTIGRPYGVAFRVDAMRRARSVKDWDEYACVIQYYDYRAELSPEKKSATTGCLNRVLARHPDYATAWAMLALLYMDDFRAGGGTGQEREAALLRFREAAARAYALAPDNLRAVQSLMLARFFEGDVSGGMDLGRRALHINPNDTEVLGEFGVRLAQTGRIEEGRRMVEQALAQNPGNANYYIAQLAIMSFMEGDYTKAERMLVQSDLHRWPLHYLTLAIVRSQMGKVAEAREDLARFMRVRPAFLDHLEAEMQARNFPSDIRDRVRQSIAQLRG